MGNEMGNNNTSAIKEEDNINEAEKKTILEDTGVLANGNGMSQDVHADIVKEENQNISTSIADDVIEKASKASNDIKIEQGKDTWQEDGHADDVKGKTQTITRTEAKDDDTHEKAIWFASNHTTSMLENDSLEGDTHASDVNMENQMLPTVEAEYIQEKATGLVSEDTATTELGKVTLPEDIQADDEKEKIQLIPTVEAEDVQEKVTELVSNDTASIVKNDPLEGDACESYMNMESQMHPTAEVEDVQEKLTGIASEYTRSSLENDLLKGDVHIDDFNVDHQKHQTDESKDDQIAARLDFEEKTREFENKPQEDKQDGNVEIPIANGTDDHGKTTLLASDDPLDLSNSSEGAGGKINEVRQPEMHPNAESVEAESVYSETLSSAPLEGTKEYEKQEDSRLGKHLSVTFNHNLNNEPSINQVIADEKETMVLTLSAVNMSNDSERQESSSVHSNYDEPVKVLSEPSLLGTESLIEDNLLDTISHFQQIKDDVLEKEMESHERLLCTDESDGKDGNEFEGSLIDTSETTSDSSSIGNSNNGNLLTKVNHTTEDSLNSLVESSLLDNPLKFDHKENSNVLYEESILSRNGSTGENSHDYKPDQCKGSLKEYNSSMASTDMSIGSNGGCNGERTIALDSSVFGFANSAQVEEPKVTENGLQFDAYVNMTSDERSGTSEQKHSVVLEAKTVFLIAGLTVVDCRHEEGESCKNKIEDTNENPEASYAMVKTFEGTEMSEQRNSDLVTINQEEPFPLQNSSSLLHVYDYHQDNVKQIKGFTASSMPNSDWKQTNESKSLGTTIDNLDYSKLTVPSVDSVGDEAFEKKLKEGEYYSQHTVAASSAGGELTAAATKSIESCSKNYTFANGGYETRDRVTRLSTESNPDNPNISCQMQKSPSFNLNLRMQARTEESDQTPLLHQDKSANESLSNHNSLILINSMPHDEEMPVEEKIVTMERSYSKKSKAPFIGLLKEEEEAHVLVMTQTQGNHVGTKKEVSSTSPKGKERRKPRSSFFSNCMCCATVAN